MDSDQARPHGTTRFARSTRPTHTSHIPIGSRLIECTELVNIVEGKSLRQIFGSPDDMKFHSSVTLFSLIEPRRSTFQRALDKYFDGELDERTIAIIGRPSDDRP